MFEFISDPGSLKPEELEAVYAISRAVSAAVNMDVVLDEIIRLTRPVFIFDNIVLYLRRDSNSLEPAYARAIGRGRSQGADLTWGEAAALDALQSEQVVIRQEHTNNYEEERMRLQYQLGLPLRWGGDQMGALVFIRFGGPSFQADQIRLSEFIALHVAQLLGHDTLVQRIANLEAERRLDRLQEDFIATVSHELLTPLGFIKGYATTLLRDDISWDPNTRSEFLSIIDEEADRLRELIENLMDSSRLQAGTLRMSFQPIRMDTFLKDMTLRAASRQADLQISLDVRHPGMQIHADPTRLAQVFDNLISNAVKYAPGSPIQVSLDKKDRKALIEVRDSGPGIAAEHLKNLFKRFYRAPSNNVTVRGTGLGLFICRRIIQAHGGEITAESESGVGTVFRISLPLERTINRESISFRESAV
jgi:two-component system sensor histidine kinase KdpD